mmetsp:Transcript_20288/g.51249  ORF Transcript_20288/g.51249 Transcript_20288/m.51249 type:complete len:214 (+) Transcript_20288:1214-1855(+)
MPRSSAAAIFFSASVTATPSPPGSTPCFKRSFTPSPGPETIFDFEELPGAEICTATGFDPLLVVSPPACSFARASLSAILAAQIFPAAPHSLCDFLLFVVFKQAGQVIPRCTSSPGRSSVPPSSFFVPHDPLRVLFFKNVASTSSALATSSSNVGRESAARASASPFRSFGSPSPARTAGHVTLPSPSWTSAAKLVCSSSSGRKFRASGFRFL